MMRDMIRHVLVSILPTPRLTELEMFIIVINILSGSGDLSDSLGKGLLKKVIVCNHRREIQLCD